MWINFSLPIKCLKSLNQLTLKRISRKVWSHVQCWNSHSNINHKKICKSQPTTHTCRILLLSTYDNNEQSLFYLMNHQNLNTQFGNSEKFTQQHGPKNCLVSIFTKKLFNRSLKDVDRKKVYTLLTKQKTGSSWSYFRIQIFVMKNC